ncbi:MAG: hypothetical protein WB586_16895 [Chthoniobacterales bacterium]
MCSKKWLVDAQPFRETFSKAKVDLDAVESELEKVALGALHRDQLCGQLGRSLGVKVEMLRAIGAQPGAVGRSISFPEVDPWPEQVSGDSLVQDMMDIIRKHIVLEGLCCFHRSSMVLALLVLGFR